MSMDAGNDDGRWLADQVGGHIVTQIIASAVRFQILDQIASGVTGIDRLSELTGIEPGRLRRFLRALKGLGLVAEHLPDGYHLCPPAALLLRADGGLYGQALMSGAEYYQAWAELDYALTSGRPAFERAHGSGLWEKFHDDDALIAAFTRMMRWNSERAMKEILEVYEFPRSGAIADLGAGDGTLVAELLERYPELRAIVVETGTVIRHSRHSITARGLERRCEFVTGNFLEAVPEGASLYILKAVLHNWNDENALRILRNVRKALTKSGRLLVIERLPVADNVLGSAIRDLTMLVLFGGQERSQEEYTRLLVTAGLGIRRAATTPAGLCLLEAAVEVT
jgi:ubiquinone/menaquinone biosynthesis C-methylase UbiE